MAIKILFQPGQRPLFCFDFFQVLWDKTLWSFSVRLILHGSKGLSWMILPNDSMARLAAMFHAAFWEHRFKKTLARCGYQTLTKFTRKRVHQHVRADSLVRVYAQCILWMCMHAPSQTSVSTIALFRCFWFSLRYETTACFVDQTAGLQYNRNVIFLKQLSTKNTNQRDRWLSYSDVRIMWINLKVKIKIQWNN